MLVRDNEYFKQSARNRIKSISIDWYGDNIGADLEEILGQPNTQEVAKQGEDKIISALSFDNLFLVSEIVIDSYPLSRSMLAYNIEIIKDGFGKIKLDVTLDMVKGVTIKGV